MIRWQKVGFGEDNKRLGVLESAVLVQFGMQRGKLHGGRQFKVGRNDENQQSVAFGVAQEPETKADPTGGALNKPGQVGDHKALPGACFYNAQGGVQGSEWVISHLGTGRTDRPDKCRFPGVRKAHKPCIGHQFQFKPELKLPCGAPLRELSGGPVPRSRKGGVAAAVGTALHDQKLPAVIGEIGQKLSGLVVEDLCSRWDPKDKVFPRCARAVRRTAGLAVFGTEQGTAHEIRKSGEFGIHLKVDASAVSTVTAGRASLGYKGFPAESYKTIPTLSGTDKNDYPVYESAVQGPPWAGLLGVTLNPVYFLLAETDGVLRGGHHVLGLTRPVTGHLVE